MPLLFLLPFAGSITLFVASFAVGFTAVKLIQKFKNKTPETQDIYFSETTEQAETLNRYAPAPVKDKTVLTEYEKSAWEQIVANSK